MSSGRYKGFLFSADELAYVSGQTSVEPVEMASESDIEEPPTMGNNSSRVSSRDLSEDEGTGGTRGTGGTGETGGSGTGLNIKDSAASAISNQPEQGVSTSTGLTATAESSKEAQGSGKRKSDVATSTNQPPAKSTKTANGDSPSTPTRPSSNNTPAASLLTDLDPVPPVDYVQVLTVMEQSRDHLQDRYAQLETRIADLERELDTRLPANESADLQDRLRDQEATIQRLEQQVNDLQQTLDNVSSETERRVQSAVHEAESESRAQLAHAMKSSKTLEKAVKNELNISLALANIMMEKFEEHSGTVDTFVESFNDRSLRLRDTLSGNPISYADRVATFNEIRAFTWDVSHPSNRLALRAIPEFVVALRRQYNNIVPVHRRDCGIVDRAQGYTSQDIAQLIREQEEREQRRANSLAKKPTPQVETGPTLISSPQAGSSAPTVSAASDPNASSNGQATSPSNGLTLPNTQ
ncbi:hypothetical protein VTL71DRAFT_9396 [Oculimacula yallundae]|uniref:Uncharacterized protein n=1 Tax=Oculimacula yallundae TaxID=86028 RepID=A0ABR4BUL6_9HELO